MKSMKRRRTHKKIKLTYIKTMMIILFLCLLFIEGYIPYEQTGENLFHVSLNGEEVGVLENKDLAEELLIQARKNVASKSSELVFMETELTIVGEEVVRGAADSRGDVLARMEAILEDAVQESLHRSYTMKVNELTINLASVEDARQLLQAAVDRYDTEGEFVVELVQDSEREFNVLTTRVTRITQTDEGLVQTYGGAGVQGFFDELDGEVETEGEMDFEDYELGILEIDFYEDVELVEVYLPESQLTSLEDAINQVVMEQEAPSIYEVVAGDTLYEIALELDIPIDKIVEMNDFLETAETTLHIGDQILITVPEPELSMTRVEQDYYEEVYDADVIYIDNDEWYTTKSVVHQQPSAGFRKVVVDVTYLNDKEVDREILKEEIVLEAVPMIVERGTKIPPTYIKPLSGGRLSSNFGTRSAPTAGASTYHKGVDWATPTGTTVVASCGGTVAFAGWGGGYGYVVYINHPDGRQTRYAHCSKVLVSVGQTVTQGQKIALSGNTGISSGTPCAFRDVDWRCTC